MLNDLDGLNDYKDELENSLNEIEDPKIILKQYQDEMDGYNTDKMAYNKQIFVS